jgi:hypothetical protein
MHPRIALAVTSLAAIIVSPGDAQMEPIPGYFELKVAYCWGALQFPLQSYNAAVKKDCNTVGIRNEFCSSDQKMLIYSEEQADPFRDYLFTGTADHGANSGVAVASQRGRDDWLSLDFNGLPSKDALERLNRCDEIRKELPY